MKNLILLVGLLLSATPSQARTSYNVYRMPASGNIPGWGPIDLSQSGARTGILPNANTTATSANTASAIVARDGSGNFSAGTITAALSGNASTATALAANPVDCNPGDFAIAIAANGDLTCATPTGSQAGIQFQDEGSNLGTSGTVDTIDFVGANVTASRASNKVTVTISGGGDVSSNTSSSVDSEVALFNGTTGKSIKRATGTGFAKLTSGVLSAQTDISNSDINAAAAIARSKLASGTANHVLINDGSGVMSSEASLATTRGGTGLSSFTTGDTLYASATNTLSKLAACADGEVLKFSGGVPTCGIDNGNYAATDTATYSMVVTGSTSNPSLGATPSTNLATWRRDGNEMVVTYTLEQVNAGSAGSGVYLFSLPAVCGGGACSIDTAKITASTGNMKGVVGPAVAYNSAIPTIAYGIVKAYDSTHLALYLETAGTSGGGNYVGSSYFALGNATMNYSFSARFPINGWTSTLNGAYAKLSDVKASNTAGGTFTSGAWQTRTLNTEYDPSGIVTLSSNQFTLTAGTYRIKAHAPAYNVDGHMAKIRNITDSTDVLLGTSEFAYNAANVPTRSIVDGEFTITGTKTFELQHQCKTTFSTNGFGQQVNISGVNEEYSVVEIFKIY